MVRQIQLAHGNGGKDTEVLLHELFYRYFGNPTLLHSLDAACFSINGRVAYTTDSFVVKPLFFSGGDIGKLAVCGTINDLVVSGAKPLYLSCGFILEEGLEIELLERIVESMSSACKAANVLIVTGDTKVVEKGSVDKIFINTSGIGIVNDGYEQKQIGEGDRILITGGIGEHGTTIGVERYRLNVKGDIRSDCMSLDRILDALVKNNHLKAIKLMKDPTRGGVATVLNEIAQYANIGVHLMEKDIPIRQEIAGVNQILGLEPLYLANEGRMLLVVEEGACDDILHSIRSCDGCEGAAVIGRFTVATNGPIVLIENQFGGKRILPLLEGEMLPRIC
ncbi:MAG TPA: hydrogenase expression/formation protein HypE [Lachnospiraceae bacterium]|nr:hydrogenase expression/formation protein HypE [Lachnospiraceae bacterium]